MGIWRSVGSPERVVGIDVAAILRVRRPSSAIPIQKLIAMHNQTPALDYSPAIQAIKLAAWCFGISTLGLGVGLFALDEQRMLSYIGFGVMVIAGLAAHVLAVVGWFRVPRKDN